ETVYSANPIEVAAAYAASGARRLHVVDLDAARGSGDNRALIDSLLERCPFEVQVAGGIRSEGGLRRWLEAGAAAVVMGTAAVREPELLGACARRHPAQVLAALDVKDGGPAVTGWTESSEHGVQTVLASW